MSETDAVHDDDDDDDDVSKHLATTASETGVVHDDDDDYDDVCKYLATTASLDDEAPPSQSTSPPSDPLQSQSQSPAGTTKSTRKGSKVSFSEPPRSSLMPLPSIQEDNHTPKHRSSFQQLVVDSSNILRQRRRKRESVVRNSTSMDQDTGEIITKECVAEMISSKEDHEGHRRSDKALRNSIQNVLSITGMGTTCPHNSGVKHYRLHSRHNGRSDGNGTDNDNENNHWIKGYIHWSFRTSFLSLLASFTLMFFALTILFALVMYLIAWRQPRCFGLADSNKEEVDMHFENTSYSFLDAYALSWTTFSTVGYGMVYPSVGTEGNSRCMGIKMFAAFESFFGILYASFAGAIIFGKVARIQSIARIIWSDPIVVRYGSGVRVDDQNVDEPRCHITTRNNDNACPAETFPCPILEFRIVNQLYNQMGGEIVDGNIRLVATVAKSRVDSRKTKSLRKAERVEEKTASAREKISVVQAGVQAIQQLNARRQTNRTLDRGSSEGSGLESFNNSSSLRSDASFPPEEPSCRMPIAVDDEESGPPLVFAQLQSETDSHPFFKRVWIVRHRLDENSPLLSTMAKRMIRQYGGNWPQTLNHHSKVREHLQFHQLIVTFSGTARVSGSSVYAHKVYDFVDVNIGYRFANLLAKKENGALVVDHCLINDVAEQHGGGAEPFQELDEEVEIGLLQSTVSGAKNMTAGAKDFMMDSGKSLRSLNIGIDQDGSRSGNQSSPINTTDPAHMV